MRDGKKVVVVGSGYVGMSMSLLLAQKCEVIVLDIDTSRVDKVNSGEPTVHDELMSVFFKDKELNIQATTDIELAYNTADYVIIATPTDYDVSTQFFDTSTVELVVRQAIEKTTDALIVIKSTIPIGLTDRLRSENGTRRIVLFSRVFKGRAVLYTIIYTHLGLLLAVSVIKLNRWASSSFMLIR
jgi:UDPglucose 6-dehydrogenase